MAGALGAIGTGSASVLTSCAGGGESAAANKPLKEPGTYYIPELPDKATDGKELKAGVIGCGGYIQRTCRRFGRQAERKRM